VAEVRLDCPLCRADVAGGEEPAPGVCPGCGALVRGGGDDPVGGVALALTQLGRPDAPARAVAQSLFGLTPAEPRGRLMAVTSDVRDDFYRWWVFVRARDDAAAGEALMALIED